MKIVALMENEACSPEFASEHGLSLYVETSGYRILFDTGASPAFADNAARLGVDLAKVDMAVLSHGHYDHSGGLDRFFDLNAHALVYVSEYAFGTYLNASGRYIGIDEGLAVHPRVVRVGDAGMTLADGIEIHSCNHNERPFGTNSYGQQVLAPEGPQPDDYRHEQYLLIKEQGKKVLLSGCSHKGILNIAHWFQPDVLVGGFHLMKLSPESDAELLNEYAERLMGYSTLYYTGHCTGAGAFSVLKKRMGERLRSFAAGQVWEL